MAQMLNLWQLRTTLSSLWLLLGMMSLGLPPLVRCRGADVVWLDSLDDAHLTSARPGHDIDVEVSKEVSVGGEPEISISFNHSGKAFRYRLAARDVFAEGAELVAHTDEGEQRLAALPVSTFVSRLEGQWASVAWHEDGSVSGLFEHRGEVLHLHATMQEKPIIALRSHGSGVVRFVASLVGPLDGGAGVAGTVVSAGRRLRNGTSQASDVGEAPAVISMSAVGGKVDQWWPGCYEGDGRQHVLSLGIVADKAAWDLYKGGLRSKIVAAVSQASFIYEQQMNIRLQIAELSIFQTAKPGSPTFAGDCADSSEMASGSFMDAKLNSLASYPRPLRGAWHLFTGCGDGQGVIGAALRNTMCTSEAVSVSQLKAYSSVIAFAHELGHNLGAGHSFQNGKGKTGGIMDYETHEVNGVLQFNTKFSRDEMCNAIQASKPRCGMQFRSST